MRIRDWSSDLCSSDLTPSAERNRCDIPWYIKGLSDQTSGTPNAMVVSCTCERNAEPSSHCQVRGRGADNLYECNSARSGAVPASTRSAKCQIGRAAWRERVCQYV